MPNSVPASAARGAVLLNGRTHPHPAQTVPEPTRPPVTDERLLGDYHQWLINKGRARDTIRAYLGTTRKYRAWVAETTGRSLLEATRDDFYAWRSTFTGAAATVRCYVSHVRSFYHWASVTARAFLPDPTVGCPVPKPPRRRPRPMDDADLELAIDTSPLRVRPWFVLGGYAGLRAVEISTLHTDRWFPSGPHPYMIVIAKGGGERVIPLSPYVIGEIEPVIPRRGWFFLRKDDRPGHVSKSAITRLTNQHLTACGITVSFHGARHRFGTVAQRLTGDLRVTQELMGHADPKTTSGYAEPSNPFARRAVLGAQPSGRRLRAARALYAVNRTA